MMLVPTHIAWPFAPVFRNSRLESAESATAQLRSQQPVRSSYTALIFRHQSPIDADLSQAKHVEVFAKSNAAIRIRHLLGRANQRNGRDRHRWPISAISYVACDVCRHDREFPYH